MSVSILYSVAAARCSNILSPEVVLSVLKLHFLQPQDMMDISYTTRKMLIAHYQQMSILVTLGQEAFAMPWGHTFIDKVDDSVDKGR